jgi:hypothetical protein
MLQARQSMPHGNINTLIAMELVVTIHDSLLAARHKKYEICLKVKMTQVRRDDDS